MAATIKAARTRLKTESAMPFSVRPSMLIVFTLLIGLFCATAAEESTTSEKPSTPSAGTSGEESTTTEAGAAGGADDAGSPSTEKTK